MTLLIKVIALQLAWLASLSVYLTASQQVFLRKPVSKKAAWISFVVLVIFSALLLNVVYHPLTSAIFVLCALMASWITLALWAPAKKNTKHVLISGTLVSTFIALLGVNYVG